MTEGIEFYNQILVLLINIIGFGLAGLISKSERRAPVSRYFVMMIVFMFGWVNFAYFARITPSQELALLFLKIAWVATPLLFVSLYLFTVGYIDKQKKYKWLTRIITTLGIGASFITAFSHLIIKSPRYLDGMLAINYGSGMFPFLGVIFLFIVAPFYVIFSEYKKVSDQKKIKLQYLITGAVLFCVMNLTFNIVLPIVLDIVHLYWIGDYSSIILLGFIAYAIVKRDLFDIKIILTTIWVSLVAVLLVIDLFLFSQHVWMQIIKAITLITFLFLGRYLIKSVSGEIDRREELENLSDELVETNIKLKEANKKLKKLDKAKSEFISIASHQLRTPLTAIKGYLSMVVEGNYGELPKKAKEKLKEVLGSAERLISLVNDLLNVSRIESGKIDMKFKETDLEQFIEQVIKELKIVAEKEGLYLKFEKDFEENSKVELDQSRMRQVILNIIDNAIKYTEEGGITVKAKEQQLESGQDSVLIIIKDTGEGMTQKDINNIFNSFSRGSAGELMHTEGAGLGLYIAKKFIDMHHGSIWIESEGKRKGTKFLIELPLKQN